MFYDIIEKRGVTEVKVEHPVGDPLLCPFTAAVEAVQPGAGYDPVNTQAALAAEMQFLPVDAVDNQVPRRNRQLAVNAGIVCGHHVRIQS